MKVGAAGPAASLLLTRDQLGLRPALVVRLSVGTLPLTTLHNFVPATTLP